MSNWDVSVTMANTLSCTKNYKIQQKRFTISGQDFILRWWEIERVRGIEREREKEIEKEEEEEIETEKRETDRYRDSE